MVWRILLSLKLLSKGFDLFYSSTPSPFNKIAIPAIAKIALYYLRKYLLIRTLSLSMHHAIVAPISITLSGLYHKELARLVIPALSSSA
jgi:hypothetical protein